MHDCAVDGCSQPTLGKPLCYFHRKQACGLIEISVYEERAATEQEVEMFEQYKSLARSVGMRFATKSKNRSKSMMDFVQIGYLALWKQIRCGDYKIAKYLVSYLQSSCWNAMYDAVSGVKSVDAVSIDSMLLCAPESPEGTCIRVDTLKRLKHVIKRCDKLDRAIFHKNIYPIMYNVQSLRSLAKSYNVSHVTLSTRKKRLLKRLKREVG
jgi:RNA polymerase sigma factor (sigma-70 family)